MENKTLSGKYLKTIIRDFVERSLVHNWKKDQNTNVFNKSLKTQTLSKPKPI